MKLQDRTEYGILSSEIHRTKCLNLHLRLVENVLSIHFYSQWNASRLTLAHWRKEYLSVREKTHRWFLLRSHVQKNMEVVNNNK